MSYFILYLGGYITENFGVTIITASLDYLQMGGSKHCDIHHTPDGAIIP